MRSSLFVKWEQYLADVWKLQNCNVYSWHRVVNITIIVVGILIFVISECFLQSPKFKGEKEGNKEKAQNQILWNSLDFSLEFV